MFVEKEDSRERDKENLILKSTIDELSAENNRLRAAIEDFTAKKCGLRCEIVKTLVKEFAAKLKQNCRNFYPSVDHYCCSEKAVSVKEIDRLLIEYDFPECLNCEAFSGTDCIRNPHTEGCLKEENKK